MHGTQALKPSQTFVTAGGFDTPLDDQAWSITGGHGSRPQEALQFKGNHEEADTRVWFHAFAFAKALIFSPDTDTFMVGLSLLQQCTTAVCVRLDKPGAKDQVFLDSTGCPRTYEIPT